MAFTLDQRHTRHPLLEDFLQQNPACEEESAERAFLVYQDLSEVRGWWFTELAYSDALDRPYITGQVSRRLPCQAVLPVTVSERISLHDVQTFFCKIHDSAGTPVKSLTLAVNESDSTVVYYKLTSGLSPPDPPEVTTQRKEDKAAQAQRKRFHVAACVRRAMEAAWGDDEEEEL